MPQEESFDYVVRVVPATRTAVAVMSDLPNFLLLQTGSYLLQTDGVSKIVLVSK